MSRRGDNEEDDIKAGGDESPASTDDDLISEVFEKFIGEDAYAAASFLSVVDLDEGLKRLFLVKAKCKIADWEMFAAAVAEDLCIGGYASSFEVLARAFLAGEPIDAVGDPRIGNEFSGVKFYQDLKRIRIDRNDISYLSEPAIALREIKMREKWLEEQLRLRKKRGAKKLMVQDVFRRALTAICVDAKTLGKLLTLPSNEFVEWPDRATELLSDALRMVEEVQQILMRVDAQKVEGDRPHVKVGGAQQFMAGLTRRKVADEIRLIIKDIEQFSVKRPN